MIDDELGVEDELRIHELRIEDELRIGEESGINDKSTMMRNRELTMS